MSKPITIKDIDFDRIDRETIECWVAGDFVGQIVKHIARAEMARRNCAGSQVGAHEWIFIPAQGSGPQSVLNVGGTLRQAKASAAKIIAA